MLESEEIEEVLDEDVELGEMDPVELKRYVSAIQSELRNISDFRWEYVKKLWKYGMTVWFAGLFALIGAFLVYGNPDNILNTPPFTVFVLVLAVAVPVLFTVVAIRKYRNKIKELEKVRKKLLSKYEDSIMSDVKERIEKMENDLDENGE